MFNRRLFFVAARYTNPLLLHVGKSFSVYHPKVAKITWNGCIHLSYCWLSGIKKVKLWFQSVTNKNYNRRYILIHKKIQDMRPIFLQSFPAIHVLTGCDVGLTIYRIWKKISIKSCFQIECKRHYWVILIRWSLSSGHHRSRLL